MKSLISLLYSFLLFPFPSPSQTTNACNPFLVCLPQSSHNISIPALPFGPRFHPRTTLLLIDQGAKVAESGTSVKPESKPMGRGLANRPPTPAADD